MSFIENSGFPVGVQEVRSRVWPSWIVMLVTSFFMWKTVAGGKSEPSVGEIHSGGALWYSSEKFKLMV